MNRRIRASSVRPLRATSPTTFAGRPGFVSILPISPHLLQEQFVSFHRTRSITSIPGVRITSPLGFQLHFFSTLPFCFFHSSAMRTRSIADGCVLNSHSFHGVGATLYLLSSQSLNSAS